MVDGEAYWESVRAQFEQMPGVAYLNTGTCGRTPKPVSRVAGEWRSRIAAEPCEVLWRRLPDALWTARVRLAAFVGAEPENITFTCNVTAAVNTVTSGLRLEAGRCIALTDQEYGAMVFAWQRAAARADAELRTISLPFGDSFTRDQLLDRFDAALDRDVQLLFLSHISTATGLVLPLQEICALARQRGILTVVDGAHAPGMIPIDVRSIGCDFYAANGHKWLLAPIGSGFLYVRPGLEERLEPILVSWGWKYDRTQAGVRDNDGSTPYIRSHEFQGTRDPAPWLAIPAAIEFHDSVGRARIDQRCRELATYARTKLAQVAGLRPTTPGDPALTAALASFTLPSCEPAAVQRTLWDRYLIETPVLDRPQGQCLRVSTHFYNTRDEVDRLGAAVAEILGRNRS